MNAYAERMRAWARTKEGKAMIRNTVLATVALGALVVATTAGCEPKGTSTNPCDPDGCVIPTKAPAVIHDGIWKVGPEVVPGTYTGITDVKGCVWFVGPGDGPTYRDQKGIVTITLKAGDEFTTSGCPNWVEGEG